MGSQTLIPSVLRFRGSRAPVLRELVPLLPKGIRTFADLMCGGGDVFANSRAERYIVNDRNPAVAGMYSWLKERQWQGLSDELEELSDAYSLADPSARIDGRRRLMEEQRRDGSPLKLLLLSFASEPGFRFGPDGAFNAPPGKMRKPITGEALRRLKSFMMRLRLKDPAIRCGDFAEGGWLDSLGEGDFAYADPPFLADGGKDGWTEADDRRLMEALSLLSLRGVRFALSQKVSGRDGTNYAVLEWARRCRLHLHALGADHSVNGLKCSRTEPELLITNY